MAHLTGTALTQAEIDSWFVSGTYTPTLANLAIGTGGSPTNTASFTFAGFPAGGILTVEGKIVFGTTAPTLPGASQESISLPSGYSMILTDTSSGLAGTLLYVDVSAATLFDGLMAPLTATTVGLYVKTVSGTAIAVNSALTATVPFTWAINDEIRYRFVCRATGP